MIPRIKIAHLPTPVEFLPRLTAELGGPKIWVKRDDQTGLAMGGNKTRKLEYVLAEAQANGAKTLITVGAAQSNHCRQTAALAKRVGLDCILVLNGNPPAVADGNYLLDRLFDAEIVWTTRPLREKTSQEVFEKAWEEGRRPFLIPVGASTPTGALGYWAAFDELMKQEVEPDWIVIASSSAGTQAGLALGAHLAGWKGNVLGISIDEPERDLQEMVAGIATEASDRLGKKTLIRPEDIHVNADYLGEGYGILGAPEIEAIQMFAAKEGLLLDPVYTGRAAAGLIDLVRKGFFKPTDKVLFWHTGGTPALFAEGYSRKISESFKN